MRVIYKAIKVSSFIIRQFLLPNPFEMLQNGVLYNWAATIILGPITYIMVRQIYDRGSAPIVGSLLFFVLYLINTGVLILCSVFGFNIFACITIGIAYLTLFVMVVKVRNFAFGGY